MKYSTLFLFLLLFASACNKDNDKACWQVYDNLGNEMGLVCNMTEAEVQAMYGPFYDRAGAAKFCWMVYYNNGSTQYAENLTERMAAYWFSPSASRWEKVICGYCQRWATREKRVFKPSGQFAYSSISNLQYCGDTCNTIFPGRQIILRETTDSVIYHEFLQKL
ncbi:MAG TPA: hypothetical protein VFX58_00980 [Chitinophagaceae bacterium]|nr:hypothetical protein [Chitinophagaceae bacterium]